MKEKTEWYSVSNTTILFSTWHILLAYFSNSMKLIWNHKKDNRPLTPSAHSWKNFDNCQRKTQAGNFAMFEIVPRRLVVKWMLVLLRNLFNTLQGFLRNLCCTFPEIIKTAWIWWKISLLLQWRMLQYACKMIDFKKILGPNTFSKLLQFTIFGWKCLIAWASEGFFPGSGHYWILQNLFLGGQKWWNLVFTIPNWKNSIFC